MSGAARFAMLLGTLALSTDAVAASEIPRFASVPKGRPAPSGTARRPAAFDLSSLPVYFEGEPGGKRFQTRTASSGLLFETGGFWMGVGTGEASVRVKFQGARQGADPVGQGALEAHSNYFLGSDPSRWSTRQHFSGVRYDALWPGIDLVFYAQHRELEYDFDVAPHADPSRIRLRVDGAQAVTLDGQGELWIATPSGKSKQRRPVIYQEIDGRRVAVSGGYRMASANQIGFWIGDYDHSQKLVIDPVLEFSTYLGGRGYDVATAVAVDTSSNIYVTGYTQFADFAASSNPQRLTNSRSTGPNVFVVKLDAVTRQIVYIDFWGGSFYDFPWKITVDSGGSAWVVGETESSDIPLVSPILSNPQLLSQTVYGFVARFGPSGALNFSTYTAPGSIYGMAVTTAGSAWVAGSTPCLTTSAYANAAYHEFKPTNGVACAQGQVEISQTGYMMLLTPGVVQYSTFFVPSAGSGKVNGISDVAVDSQNNVYVAGSMAGQYQVQRAVPSGTGFTNTSSPNLVCEVSKFNASGSYLWTASPLLQGSADQECLRIAVDSNSNMYVTGYTTSSDFTTTAGAVQTKYGSPGRIPNVQGNALGDASTRPLWDAFAAAYDSSGTRLIYSTYFGGSADEYGFGIAVDSGGNAYITGYTNSSDFQATPGAAQTAYGGGEGDAYVTGFSPDGKKLVYSTFFGGSGQDEGYQVAIDRSGNVYMAGATGSANLPITSDALQNTARNVDGLVAKFNFQTCTPTLQFPNPLLSASAGTTSLSVTTNVAGCSWNLSSTGSWLQFTPASGSGNQSVSVAVGANNTTKSRLAIVTANSRRTFVYQAAPNTNCQYVFMPGEMALSADSSRQLLAVQSADQTCTWTAASDQPWLHILSSGGGPGSGTITIGTDPNTTATVRTGHITVGNQSLTVGQSAGGCPVTVSAGANAFGPAGGLGSLTVLTGSSLCPWQVQSPNSWIQVPAASTGTSYGRGTIRFAVQPNTGLSPRTGTITVSGQTVTIDQDSQFNSLRDVTSSYLSSTSTAAASLSPAVRGGSGSRLAAAPHSGVVTGLQPRGNGTCGSVNPSMPITLDAAGDPVTVTISRTAPGCSPGATVAKTGTWLQISGPNYPSGTNDATFTFSTAKPNTDTAPRTTAVGVNPGETGTGIYWYWTVNQLGTAPAPLAIKSPAELQAQAGTAVVQITSANPAVSDCTWTVDAGSVPSWVALKSSTGACGSQLQFDYPDNTSNAHNKATLRFTSNDTLDLDQPPAAATACAYHFQETAPQSVGAGGGTVTFNVVTTAGCNWSPNTDSSSWISFPTGASGSGPGPLTVQVAANTTSGQQMAQIYVNDAVAYISEAAGSFPTGCIYTLVPGSNAFTNASASFTFAVQTGAGCVWQPSQPAADASFSHLSSTAQVTGSGSVTFTVDANPTGSGARSSSITVATGVTFTFTQAAGPTPGCTYTLVPTSTSFTNSGGTFTFAVQTNLTTCSWQPTQPTGDSSFAHLQSSAQVTGGGSVTFTVDPNPAGNPARSSSIGIATATFTFTEAAGSGSALTPTFTAAQVQNGGSFLSGGVTPGMIIAIKGSNLGPAQLAGSSVANGKVATTAGGTQVFFDGQAAPMLYSLSVQVGAVVPYAVAGKTSTSVQVSYNGVMSAAVSVPVLATSPALFTNPSGGTGPGAILNQDQSVNTASNQASPGDIITIYATGEGQTNPAGVDGLIANSVYPSPVGAVSVTIGGQTAQVLYAGAAPGAVAGAFQVNAKIPAGLQGNQPVVVKVGSSSSLAGVTVALKGTAPSPAGTLKATPNPLNVCSANTSANVTLSWSTSNVTAVQILAGSLAGTVVASGTSAGSVTVNAPPGTTYLLVDMSSGGTPTSANILATVTLGQGTCTTPAGTLTVTPSVLNVCSATTSASVTLSWTTSNVTAVKIYSGSLSGTAVATGSSSGSVTVQATPNTTFLLVDTSAGGTPTSANVLSSVTTQQGTCLLPPSGTLTASPNPMNVCTATTSASVTLGWSTANVSSVKVVAGSLTGTSVATGGPTGSVTVQTTPNTSYLLVDTSGGGTPTSSNILSTVTMQQGTCPNQAGAVPPTTDLAQTNSSWQIQFLLNGVNNGQGGATDVTSPVDVLDGASSIFLSATNANAILMTRNAPAGGWDFSKISTIQLAMQSDVPPGYWAQGYPGFRLQSANGTLTLQPASTSTADYSYFGWLYLVAPLAGNSNWTATTTGQFNIQNVTSIQVGFTVNGFSSWAVLLNAMFLK